MSLFKFIIYVGCLLLILFVVIYNFIYLLKILNAKNQIGVHPHPYIHHLLQASIAISLLTAILILVFLITGM
jgi:hypothetical protein